MAVGHQCRLRGATLYHQQRVRKRGANFLNETQAVVQRACQLRVAFEPAQIERHRQPVTRFPSRQQAIFQEAQSDAVHAILLIFDPFFRGQGDDQTLRAGETAKVMSDGTRVLLKLVEVREDSGVIKVDGENESRTLGLKRN